MRRPAIIAGKIQERYGDAKDKAEEESRAFEASRRKHELRDLIG